MSGLEEQIAASSSDYSALCRLGAQKEEAEARLEEKMERWMYLNDLAEQIEKQKAGR